MQNVLFQSERSVVGEKVHAARARILNCNEAPYVVRYSISREIQVTRDVCQIKRENKQF